ALPGEDGIVAIVGDQPLEALAFAVASVQSREVAIGGVEIAHELLHARMRRAREEVPVEAARLAPLVPRCEFLAHEEKFLPRIAPHESKVSAKGCEFLPVVAGHLPEERAFAVHYLVMGERQHEILGEGVEQAESDVVVMVPAVDRLPTEVT